MMEGEKKVRQEISKVIEDCSSNMSEKWTEVVKKAKKPKTSVIHVVPKDKKTNSDQTKAAIKNAINANDLSIQGLKKAANGSILIECDNENSSEILLEQTTLKLSEEFVVKKPLKRLPRVKLLKVKDAVENDDDFLSDLKKRNPFIGDKMEIVKREDVKIKGKKIDDLQNIVLEIDGETYQKIMEKGRLKTGYESSRVVDNIYIRRCYKCYGFNHNAADCTRKAVCSCCASHDHNYKDCKANEEKCTNCVTKNNNLNIHLDVKHSVWSRECPVYKRKLEISKRGISYLD
jgi:hypothetical protein